MNGIVVITQNSNRMLLKLKHHRNRVKLGLSLIKITHQPINNPGKKAEQHLVLLSSLSFSMDVQDIHSFSTTVETVLDYTDDRQCIYHMSHHSKQMHSVERKKKIDDHLISQTRKFSSLEWPSQPFTP